MTRRREDPLVQQLVAMVGAEPSNRAELRRQVRDMRSMQRALRNAVSEYEAQVPRFIEWLRSGGDRFGVYPRFFGKANREVDAALEPIRLQLLGYHRLLGWKDPLYTERHYTQHPEIVAAMPATFAGLGVQEFKHGVEDALSPHWDATIAYYPHHPGVNKGPTRKVLMYDLTTNEFVVEDPWEWRRKFAVRFAEPDAD